MDLSVIILTHNEEANLPACLESIRDLDCEIFVVDSGSTDRTVEIARQYGAEVAEHGFETHAKQWEWALRNLPLGTEWVLGLDADQRLTPELADEIQEALGAKGREQGARSEEQRVGGKWRRAEGQQKSRERKEGGLEDIDGFYIKRRQVFRGRWIRHGGYYPRYLLKLFRRDRVRMDPDDLVDHHFYVPGRVRELRHDLIEKNHKENDISFWIDKHNRYASLLAREELQRMNGNRNRPLTSSPVGNPDQRALWLKQLWHRSPLYARPFFYFLYRYFLRLGFLDGKEGFIFHFLQGFWFRLLVDIKIEEMRKGAGSKELGAGSREPGAGSLEPGARSREQGAGDKKSDRILAQRR